MRKSIARFLAVTVPRRGRFTGRLPPSSRTGSRRPLSFAAPRPQGERREQMARHAAHLVPPLPGRRADGAARGLPLRRGDASRHRRRGARLPRRGRQRPESDTYGQIVHETPMPYVGDELHHFGWNRCSSACHGPDRSHLIIPGFRSSRIYVVNVADDPLRPQIEKVIEPDEDPERPATRGRTRPTACRARTSSSRCSATPRATPRAASPSSTRRRSRSRAAGRTAARGRR